MSPLLECTEELQGCVVYILKNRGMLLVETWYHGKDKNKLMEWKASIDAMWILSADAKKYWQSYDKVFMAQEWLWYQNDRVSNTLIVITA